jgi:hypothetical protein
MRTKQEDSIKQLGLMGEAIEGLVKSASTWCSEMGNALHSTSFGKMTHKLGPLGKLIELEELHEGYQELKANNHSSAASFISSSAGVVAESITFVGGASLTLGGLSALPLSLPIGATAMSGGILLMRESEHIGHMVKQSAPILVHDTLDKFSNLYASATQFVQNAYQKFFANPNYAKKQYQDIESAMLDLGFKEHAQKLYKHLDLNQQVIYCKVTRDLFNTYCQFNEDRTIKPKLPNHSAQDPTHNQIKKDIETIQDKIQKVKKPDSLEKELSEQNTKLKTHLNQLTKEANSQPVRSNQSQLNAQSPVKTAYEFCEVLNATSQGIALVSHLTGNSRLAQQITHSAVGVSQVVMGVAQIAQYGWAAGPVGMIFGGMNTLISCFGSSDDNGMSALAEQLAFISQQIHALHEDMLLQFGKVFTALGIINTNIIQGFRLLHEDQAKIFTHILKLQKDLSTLQNSVNALGQKIDNLDAHLQGYVLEGDNKQLQLAFNEIREKSKRPFNRLKLHPEVLAAFKTYNEQAVAKKINQENLSSAEISKSLTTQLGSAEANTGLLLNFAKNKLNMNIKLPIADPEQWRQCADLLMEMVEKENQNQQEKIIGVEDYNDFMYLKQIGENWLTLIEEFKAKPDQPSKLVNLFQDYRRQLIRLVTLIEQEVEKTELESKALKPKFQGFVDLKKQQDFKFDFKRNYYYGTATEDWNRKFHNAARFMGYDHFSGEWLSHVEARKKGIAERLSEYLVELNQYHERYEQDLIEYYSRSDSLEKATGLHSSAVFMVSDITSETMPWLPLPEIYYVARQVPKTYIQAEFLGLGTLQHRYRFEKNEFIYTIKFQMHGEEKPIVIRQYNHPCTLADYLNPEEAIWLAYMGGTFPANGSYTLQHSPAHDYNNHPYYVRHYRALPTFTTSEGLRKTLKIDNLVSKISASAEEEHRISQKIQQKKAHLRQTFNEKMVQHLESLDSRNELANLLVEVDASAKLLIAFLSILFRENYQRSAVIWTKNEIIDFVKQYQNQDVYLSHQLKTNLEVLNVVEKILLEQLNLQSESAYTPVKVTLKKLTQFMELYEQYVQDDSVLKEQKNREKKQDAAMFGALQSVLIIQNELLSQGYIDAAVHLAKRMTELGLDKPALIYNKPGPTFFAPSLTYKKSGPILDPDKLNREEIDQGNVGNDKSLASNGHERTYWYSMRDAYALLQALRKLVLGPRNDNQYSPYYENEKRVFIAEPYRKGDFSVNFVDDVHIITGSHTIQARNCKWRQLPNTLLLSFYAEMHWRGIRIQIDYATKKASILLDDPYGGINFNEELINLIIPPIKSGILILFKHHQPLINISLEQLHIEILRKDLNQQGYTNACDCGPILFSNMKDYVKNDVANMEYGSLQRAAYRIMSASHPEHERLMQLIRQEDCQTYKEINALHLPALNREQFQDQENNQRVMNF